MPEIHLDREIYEIRDPHLIFRMKFDDSWITSIRLGEQTRRLIVFVVSRHRRRHCRFLCYTFIRETCKSKSNLIVIIVFVFLRRIAPVDVGGSDCI